MGKQRVGWDHGVGHKALQAQIIQGISKVILSVNCTLHQHERGQESGI
jgi:hypothetical protein